VLWVVYLKNWEYSQVHYQRKHSRTTAVKALPPQLFLFLIFFFISLFQYVLYVFLSHTHSHPDLKETQDIPQINFTRHYIRGPFRSWQMIQWHESEENFTSNHGKLLRINYDITKSKYINRKGPNKERFANLTSFTSLMRHLHIIQDLVFDIWYVFVFCLGEWIFFYFFFWRKNGL